MHSKQIGSIGELKVAADLMKKGYSVFTELGDLSTVDLIALKDTDVIRIQVKSLSDKDDVVDLDMWKKGPSYHVKYTEELVDIFAVYVPEKDIVFYVNWEEIGDKSSMRFRFTKPKSRASTANLIEDFMVFDK